MPDRPFRHLVLQARWRPAGHGAPGHPPPALAAWLFDTGSLTRRLRAACAERGQAFAVEVLRTGRARLLNDEAAALGCRRSGYAWVREVLLRAGGEPWVFARTVVPLRSLRGAGRSLTRLGARPLGELLFADPQVRRGPLQVARLDLRRPLYRRACVPCADVGVALWARRSVFHIGGRPLLVCELFLPAHPAVRAHALANVPER